jgi:hypothetical protein
MKKHRARKVVAVGHAVTENVLSDHIDYALYNLEVKPDSFLNDVLDYFKAKYKNTRFAWMFTEEVKDEIKGATE